MNRRRLLRAIGLPALLFAAAAYLQARPQQAPSSVCLRSANPERRCDRHRVSRRIAPLLAKYCVGCHSEKAKQGNLVLTTLDVVESRRAMPNGGSSSSGSCARVRCRRQDGRGPTRRDTTR